MIENLPDLKRLRALLALTRMSSTIQSDVLADGTIAQRFAIPLSRSTALGDELRVKSETLFSAFQAATDAQSITPILDEDINPLAASVHVDPDGAAVVEIGDKAWRFAHAALLSSDPTRRLATLEAALARLTIGTYHAAELRALVLNAAFSYDDFFTAIGTLASSPETFVSRLREKAAIRQIGESDLLPEDVRLWDT